MQKAYRIRKNGQFHYVFRKGKSMGTHLLSLVYVRAGKLQVGFAVNKKVGHAVVRNRVRRRLREIYRLHEAEFKPGVDLVVVARSASVDAEFSALEQAFLQLARRLSLTEQAQ